jgi:hypothetical protein
MNSRGNFNKEEKITKRNANAESNEDDPVYYNLTLNNGFLASDSSGFNTPAYFTESNNQPFLFNSGDLLIGLMRCTIPSGAIPRYIFPIQIGTTQTDINLSYNFFKYRYATAPNVYLDVPDDFCKLFVQFQSELLNPTPNTGPPHYNPTLPQVSIPKPPSANNGQQDVSGQYYFIYNVESLVHMFNYTLSRLWSVYVPILFSNHGVQLNPLLYPYYTYDPISQLWSFNAEAVTFGQYDMGGNASYPRVEVYVDVLTNANTLTPIYYNGSAVLGSGNLNTCYDRRNNKITQEITMNGTPTTFTFYQMIADQSSIVGWAGFQKIIFEVSGDIIVKHSESDSVPINFQAQTTSTYQKPLIPMLVDLEVSKEQWAQNTTFIQFQASAIEQVRLISLAEKASVQNFNLNIYWLDNYGNRRPLEINSIGNPLTVKLAFFNKKFRTK